MDESHRQRTIRERLARSAPVCTPVLSTGFGSLDAATGGFPRGAIVELFGPAGCGKSTLALQMAAHTQAGGGAAAWIDAEHCFDPAQALRLGVAMEQMPVAQPDSAEEALEIVRRLAQSGAVDLLVVDSAAALVPQLELETGIGASGPGLQSRVLASGLRRLAGTIRRSGSVVLFLNQTRGRAAAGGEEEETAAGGAPLKLFAGLRIGMRGGARPRSVVLRVLKNKAAGSPAECSLAWRGGGGFTEAP